MKYNTHSLMIFKQFNTNFMIHQKNCYNVYKNITNLWYQYRIFEYLNE